MNEFDPLKSDERKIQIDASERNMYKDHQIKMQKGLKIAGLFIAIIVIVILLLVLIPVSDESISQNVNPYYIVKREILNPYTVSILLRNTRGNHPLQITKENKIENTTYNFEPLYLNATFIFHDDHTLNLRITSLETPRFETYLPKSEREDDFLRIFQHYTYNELGLKIYEDPFGFGLLGENNGKENEESLFSTLKSGLSFFDKYISFDALLQTNKIYGMGDHLGSLNLQPNQTYLLWNQNPYIGSNSGYSTSSHPFILNQLKNNKFIGIFMHNSNAIEFKYQNFENKVLASWKLAGGIIDLWVYFDSSAEWILSKYHSTIGYPHQIPFWAMGLHFQDNSIKSHEQLKDSINNLKRESIPIDSIGIGENLYEKNEMFSVNQNFQDFLLNSKSFLSQNNIKFIVTLFPYILDDPNNYLSQKMDTYKLGGVACSQSKPPVKGLTKFGHAFVLDFFNPDFLSMWNKGLKDLFNLINFEGVYLSNSYIKIIEEKDNSQQCIQYNNYPFKEKFSNISNALTIRYKAGDFPIEFSDEYNLHNFVSYVISSKTYDALHSLLSFNNSFIISESSVPGVGKFATQNIIHNSTWQDLKQAVMLLIDYNILGLNQVGADIGRQTGHLLSDELCIRWVQLGALSPLFRFHSFEIFNSIFSLNGQTGQKSKVKIILNALKIRYSILRYYFTKITEASLFGGSVIHPLLFDFPNDTKAEISDVIDNSFMIGKSLFFIPVLEEGAKTILVYFPNCKWYNFKNFSLAHEYSNFSLGLGLFVNYPLNSLDEMMLFIKGGSILPYQNTTQYTILNTEDLKSIPTEFIIALDNLGTASGTMIFDDSNDNKSSISTTYMKRYSMTFYANRMRINQLSGFEMNKSSLAENFEGIYLLGYNLKIQSACMLDKNLNIADLEYEFISETKYFYIHKKRTDEKLYAFDSIESIILIGEGDVDVCHPKFKVTSTIFNDKKQEINANFSLESELKHNSTYNLKGKLLNNKVLSLQIFQDQIKNPWILYDPIENNVRESKNATINLHEFGFKMSNTNEDFYFEIFDPESPSETIFSTKNLRFQFSDKFIQVEAKLQSKHVFGLGQRVLSFDIPDGTYSIFARDDMYAKENGKIPGNNMYGHQPFYVCQLNNLKEFVGILILTSNPIDYIIKHNDDNIIINHLLGSTMLDMFIISKGSFAEIIQSYQEIIGKPYLIPYWSLGFHQSRWGYSNLSALDQVYNSFVDNHLPFDAIWSDIDYMKDLENFVIGKNYEGIHKWVKDKLIHTGRGFIPIVDLGIAVHKNYWAYQVAEKNQLLIMSAKTHKPLVGIVWPGYSVFPDFIHPKIGNFWNYCFNYLRNQVDFTGIWLDMNEPVNFCDGECSSHDYYMMNEFPLDEFHNLYYIPSHRILDKKTLSMTAYHYNNNQDNLMTEYNLHTLNGFYQVKGTNFYFNQMIRMRPFILTRANFPGTGRYASHWLGDNFSTWEYMKYSISGILNANLFGIPHTGSDVCGFSGFNYTMDYEMCARWHQLGGFYPFFRNHNAIFDVSKEPFTNNQIMIAFKKAMEVRYSLLRYMYSSYYGVIKKGGMLFKPFLYYYPMDPNAYTFIDTTFMFGEAIYVSPILEPRISIKNVYLPNDNWYNIEGEKVFIYESGRVVGGNIEVSANLLNDSIPWFIRSGNIITWQNSTNALSANEMTKRKSDLIIIPSTYNVTFNEDLKNMTSMKKNASGILFYDHGEFDVFQSGRFHEILMNYTNNMDNILLEFLNYGFPMYQYEAKPLYIDEELEKIIIFDSPELSDIKCVKSYNYIRNQIIKLDFEYESKNQKFIIRPKSGSEFGTLNAHYTANITMIRQECPQDSSSKDF